MVTPSKAPCSTFFFFNTDHDHIFQVYLWESMALVHGIKDKAQPQLLTHLLRLLTARLSQL